MPDTFEFPRVGPAVVPLVRSESFASCGRGVINELVAFALGHAIGPHSHSTSGLLPCFTAIAGALDDLSEPVAGLRCIQPIRIGGRRLQMVDLPAGKVGTTDIPLLALAIRCQDKRALSCA